MEKLTMAFVNEYISEEDIKKYNIEALNEKLNIANYEPTWTVDNERDIYLRRVRRGREEFCDQITFFFSWKSLQMKMVLKEKGGGEQDGPQWTHYELIRIDAWDDIAPYKKEIIENLKEALTAYKTLGVYSDCTTFTATFDF